jgi:hypothetical protein
MEIHGQGFRGRGDGSGRNHELGKLGNVDLGFEKFPLRLSALVAEESVGR